jgi:hypothetical protein
MGYSPERKSAELKRMVPSNNVTSRQLSQVEGISQTTLHKWRAVARGKGQLLLDADAVPEGWSSRDKFAGVPETAALNEADQGEYCRKRGLYPAQITAWRSACEQANDWGSASSARLERATREKAGQGFGTGTGPQRPRIGCSRSVACCAIKAAAIWGATRTHNQHPTSPNRSCTDQQGCHCWRTARQSLYRDGNKRRRMKSADNLFDKHGISADPAVPFFR